jgi:CheY-like chemotaxis protein/anti-sigma regulatory factor (Ser/Thr protein kinase)
MARQNPPVRTTVSANAVVLSALDLTTYGLRTAGVTVSTTLADGLPPLSADADQLHQVLANLLINAQHALQNVVGPREVVVQTRAGRDPGTVEIEVTDNGGGVPSELRRRVFEPFFTTKPQGGGTGLGLSYSHGVVEAHGGRIELLDRDKGAAFVIVLPTVSAEVDAGHADTQTANRPPTVSGSALVVDDEPEVAEVLAEILEGEGFRVTTASGGREAKARLRAEAFDIVLSDLRMSDLDGPGLYDWIRRERPELAARTGFVTGDTLGPAVARFLAEVGRPHLEKPFTPSAVGAFAARLRRGDAG